MIAAELLLFAYFCLMVVDFFAGLASLGYSCLHSNAQVLTVQEVDQMFALDRTEILSSSVDDTALFAINTLSLRQARQVLHNLRELGVTTPAVRNLTIDNARAFLREQHAHRDITLELMYVIGDTD